MEVAEFSRYWVCRLVDQISEKTSRDSQERVLRAIKQQLRKEDAPFTKRQIYQRVNGSRVRPHERYAIIGIRLRLVDSRLAEHYHDLSWYQRALRHP